MMTKFRGFLLAAVIMPMLMLMSCIEDGFTTNPADQPEFSTDTLRLGVVFTSEGTPTHSFKVYNRRDKGVNISSIRFRDAAMEEMFRLNVDGVSGRSFENVEIRANDSIFVLVEATLPENGATSPVAVDAPLDFVTNGVTSTVVLNAEGLDVTRLRDFRVDADMTLTAERPYQIFDSLVVEPGVTLTLDPGATLYFHDKAQLRVHGTLLSSGTAEQPVNMTGDRFGQVVGRIPYEIMSGQWAGVYFSGSTSGNSLSHTSVRNTMHGVYVDSVSVEATEPVLTLVNCQLRNSAGAVLVAIHAPVKAVGCELAEGALGVVYFEGGRHVLNHCTIANNYLFSAVSGPLVYFDGEAVAGDVSNTIFSGFGGALMPERLEGMPVTLRNCLFTIGGSDDENFINTVWSGDPMFYTVREDYLFDYRLREGSDAIAAADPALTLPEAAYDMNGLPRGNRPDIGAYVFE